MTAKLITSALLEDDEIDPKDYIMGQEMHLPRTWGELRVGDVVYDPEGGAINIVMQLASTHGYRNVYYDQYCPSYAYGNYVQHLSRLTTDKLYPARIVGRAEDIGDPWQLMVELNGGKFHPNPINVLRQLDAPIAWAEGYRYTVLNNNVGDDLFFRTFAEAKAEQDRQREEGENE